MDTADTPVYGSSGAHARAPGRLEGHDKGKDRTHTCDELASITRIKSRDGAAFLDLSIEEYTGLSRRAKYTSVRLDEEAARELHAILSAKFANPAPVPD